MTGAEISHTCNSVTPTPVAECPGCEEEAFLLKAEAGALTEEDWVAHLRRLGQAIRGRP